MKRWIAAAVVGAAALALAARQWWSDPAAEALAWGRGEFRRGDHSAALRAADGALRSAPKHPEALALRAAALAKLGRSAEAIEAFAASPPRDADERFLLGSALMMAGRTAAAEAEFHQVIAHDPNRFDVRWALAQLHLGTGHPDQALPHAEAATASSVPREQANAWWLVFKLRHLLGDCERSHEAYARLVALGEAGRMLPENGETVIERAADNLVRLRRLDEAERLVKDMRGGDVGKVGAVIRARVAEARGDRAGALELFAHAARRHGDTPELWRQALRKAAEFRLPDAGRKIAAEAARKFPDDAEIRRLSADLPAGS